MGPEAAYESRRLLALTRVDYVVLVLDHQGQRDHAAGGDLTDRPESTHPIGSGCGHSGQVG